MGVGREIQSGSGSTPFRRLLGLRMVGGGGGKWRRWSHGKKRGGVMRTSVELVTGWKWVESLQVGGVTQIGGLIFRVVTEGA